MAKVKQYAAAIFGLVLSVAAQAHPHSFIDLQTRVAVDNGLLTGLQMRWTMDEITSADLLYDAGEAKPGDEIWKKLAAEVMANVMAQHYFTEFWHDGQKVKFADRPTAYAMAREGHQAVLTFTLPLAQPQPLAGQRYLFATFDPGYFVDMHYDRDSDVTLPAELQTQCRLAVQTPRPDENLTAYALSLDRADAPPEDMNLGKQFAQQVTLTCR